jgi:hypothetical protein
VQYRLDEVAYSQNLDLKKPADYLAALNKVFAEDPPLFKRTEPQTSCVLARFR